MEETENRNRRNKSRLEYINHDVVESYELYGNGALLQASTESLTRKVRMACIVKDCTTFDQSVADNLKKIQEQFR